MKTKYFLFILIALALTFNAEAQFLKKLKKKAEQAAERTVLRKTDEVVSQKTEKTIDDVTEGNQDEENKENTSSTTNQTNNTSSGNNTTRTQSPNMNPLMGSGKNAAKNLPDTYAFDWEFKTIMRTSENEEMNMDYLIKPDASYFGMQMSSKEYQQMEFMCIVVDSETETSATFMNANGQKMAMISKHPNDLMKNEKENKFSYKEIGTKKILGYECYGIEIEDADYIGTIYFTLDAPINFRALFENSKSTPKGFDPALLQVLKEEALIMEMDFKHKKKKKQNFTMTAQSLEKKKTVINTKEYQSMGF
ncbi:DUF4412 domain-containing protein [Tamlana flava]|uniref:DUF4412 domain-containing protein n=1 Tax=Tamlana flava TaxID=3158572 RepID=UPI00351BA1DC